MVYRRFGTVFSRLLLSKQDEISSLEELLLGMDKTDKDDDNEQYLMSRSLDVERGDDLPPAWQGQSRVQVIEKLEKLALQYGKWRLRSDLELPTDTTLSGAAS